MVVIKIELWPGGDESKAREIGRAVAVNDGTGTAAKGNYNVELRHGGKYVGRPGVWKRGRLGNFPRTYSPYHFAALAIGCAIFDQETKE